MVREDHLFHIQSKRPESRKHGSTLATFAPLLSSLFMLAPAGAMETSRSYALPLAKIGENGLYTEDLRTLYMLSLAEIDPSTAATIAQILGPIFASLNFLFIIRIVMSWYPQLPVDKLPYVIAFAPTEPVLEPTRRLIPPVGGVDVAPVIWVAIMSFLNEILLGQQGLLVLLSQKT